MERPGDFNQAMMELGAIVCTPKNPDCQRCPLNSSCLAYERVKRSAESLSGSQNGVVGEERDEVEGCALCLDKWRQELGVCNYPYKAKKKSVPVEEYAVAVISNKPDQFLLRQRQNKGLLAGYWEFPSVLTGEESDRSKQWEQLQREVAATTATEGRLQGDYVGSVTHHFSHMHHHYHCWRVALELEQGVQQEKSSVTAPIILSASAHSGDIKWVRREGLADCAVPASVKKIMRLLDSKRPLEAGGSETMAGKKHCKRQRTLNTFFKKE